jgi:predicted solute-binding protein
MTSNQRKQLMSKRVRSATALSSWFLQCAGLPLPMLTEVCSRGVAESTRMLRFHRSPNQSCTSARSMKSASLVWFLIVMRRQKSRTLLAQANPIN